MAEKENIENTYSEKDLQGKKEVPKCNIFAVKKLIDVEWDDEKKCYVLSEAALKELNGDLEGPKDKINK